MKPAIGLTGWRNKDFPTPPLGLVDFMDIADVGMIERRGRLWLLDEGSLSLWMPGQLRREKLKGNGRAEFRVLSKGQHDFGFCPLLDPKDERDLLDCFISCQSYIFCPKKGNSSALKLFSASPRS